MFEGFEVFDIDCDGINIHGVTGGSGPPLLLLHGYPQTHVMWHKVAPALAEKYTLVVPDLRGYGRSGIPKDAPDHLQMSKRLMAKDMVLLMATRGFDRFKICGHDRGARVAHRLALDSPDAVEKMALLDIAPTREMYANTSDAFARAYWHWFYLILPAPTPENMIAANPDEYWFRACSVGIEGLSPFSEEAQVDYLQCFRNPEVIHASCEDYRAASSIDIIHDNEDDGAKVTCPLLAIWGKQGVIEKCFDPIALWQQRAENVQGFSIPGGHYLAEESANELLKHLENFFR